MYQINCKDCSKINISQSKQHLNQRIKQHKNNHTNKSALTKHTENEDHKFDFENLKILCWQKTLEYVLIKKIINTKKKITKRCK